MSQKNKYYIIFLLALLGIANRNICTGQNSECPKTYNKKAVQLYQRALEEININPRNAYYNLKQAVEIAPDYVEALFLIADYNYQKALEAMENLTEANRQQSYFNNAEQYFLKLIEICPSYKGNSACFFLGEYYYQKKEYVLASKYLSQYIQGGQQGYGSQQKAREMNGTALQVLELVNNPVDFDPVPLKGVSTSSDEFLPLISPDGDFAFYTRREIKPDKTSYISRETEEFTFSKFEGISAICNCDSFSPGLKMPAPFNDGRNQGGVSITIDNNHLFITICEQIKLNNRPYKNCDIFESHFTNGEWGPLINLGTPVNRENTWEGHPSVTSDGKILYFASSRPDGFGGIDIYRAFRDSAGNWFKMENLGPVLNTKDNEKSPFIHSDSQTLYYSSDGKKGMGGFDIFYSKLLENGWSIPQNIGYPINNEGDDLGFVVSTDGSKAYFSSNKFNSNGGYDIYSFSLYEKARPQKVILLKGQLTDDNGEILTDAKIEIKDLETQIVREGLVDPMTGRYAVVVVPSVKTDLILTVKKKNYAFKSEYLALDSIKPKKIIKLDFEVPPIEIGRAIVLNNIYFGTNSDVLSRESKKVLNEFAAYLKENKRIKIRIDGHTDSVDTEEFNLDLSTRRARSVFEFLVNQDIDSSRLSYKGFGESQPISDNESAAGRAKNRRTEFFILAK